MTKRRFLIYLFTLEIHVCYKFYFLVLIHPVLYILDEGYQDSIGYIFFSDELYRKESLEKLKGRDHISSEEILYIFALFYIYRILYTFIYNN